jgi:serine/threonine-protein phosphatase 6 regulatory ankyrin repeat subunit B
MVAAKNGDIRAAQMLVHHAEGQGLEERDNERRTALYCAAENGHEEVVAFLLSHGARADIGDVYGRTPLILAAISGHLGVVKMLLHHAEGQGLDEHDEDGRTALCSAAENGHEEIVAFLLSQGARADTTDEYGVTPLISAAWKGHLGVVKMLLQHMGLDETNNWGRAALRRAAEEGNEEIVAFLLSQGARADIEDQGAYTPLIAAASLGHLGVVKMLMKHFGGHELDGTGCVGWTALYYAAQGGHKEIVRALLLAGVDPTSTGNMRQTPRATAHQQGHQGCVEVFNVSMQRAS